MTIPDLQETRVTTLAWAYGRFNDLLARLCVLVAGAGVAFAVFALAASAAERVLIGISFAVLNDLPPQLVPWIVFPMMGVLLRHGQHVTVDFLPAFLTGRRAHMLELLIGLLVAVASLVFLAGGMDALAFFRMLNQRSETGLNFPLWWIYAAFPTGFALLFWFAVEKSLCAALALAGAETPLRIIRGRAT
ncbi:MAG TPA: hypothetical protein DEA05_01025 [Rhodobacteraceae bacterium]|jgi:TRAP-type C4-dicarboxylate transport system permease small subunit|nr:hypothetical protein [Paracoccaceae bacterium]